MDEPSSEILGTTVGQSQDVVGENVVSDGFSVLLASAGRVTLVNLLDVVVELLLIFFAS